MQKGDGFVAYADIETPAELVRLAAPKTPEDYASQLYSAFFRADELGLSRIFVVPPERKGIGLAINDRVQKASNS